MNLSVKLITVFLLSLFLFYMVKLPLLLYLFAMVLLWGILLYWYTDISNGFFHGNVSVAMIGNFLAFGVIYCVKMRFMELGGHPWQVVGALFCVPIFAAEWRYAYQLCHSSEQENENKSKEVFLYPEHAYDLARLKSLLPYTRILGINSAWGNGKSFVVDYFCNEEETKRKYDIIKIETLAYRYDEFDQVLITKLDTLLRENHIFSFYAKEALQMLKSHMWGRFIYFFFRGNETSNASTFVGLKKELDHLPKKVLIVFEDIERVGNPEAVKKLFAIVERITGENIRVIFEYDVEQLEKELSVGRNYLEKYIPLEMNLTSLSYHTISALLWDELQMKGVDKRILYGLGSQRTLHDMLLNFADYVYNPFARGADVGKFRFGSHALTIRRMREFMIEVKAWMKKYQWNEIDDKMARAVVAFYFLKNFMYDAYTKLEPGVTLEQIFLFRLGDKDVDIKTLYTSLWKGDTDEKKEVPVHDAISYRNRILAVVKAEENREALSVFSLFWYEVFDYEKQAQYEQDKNVSPTTQDMNTINGCEEVRERTNRLIWNLLQNGKSEYSNSRACAEKLVHDVLHKPETEWEQAWNLYCQDLYSGHIFKDNSTVNMIGHPYLLDITKAFSYDLHSEREWLRYVEFVQWRWGEKSIDMDLIQVYNAIAITSVPVMFSLMKYFTRLPVIGNMNAYEPYHYFLIRFVNRLAELGFISRKFYRYLNGIDEDIPLERMTKFLDFVVKDIADDAGKQNLLDTETYRNDLACIVQFMQKNRELIAQPESLEERRPQINFSESRSASAHQGTVDSLLKNFHGKPFDIRLKMEILKELDMYYESGDLYPSEIRKVKRELKKWEDGDNSAASVNSENINL